VEICIKCFQKENNINNIETLKFCEDFGYQGSLHIGHIFIEGSSIGIYLTSQCICGKNTKLKLEEAREFYDSRGSDQDDRIYKLYRSFYCPECKNSNFLTNKLTQGDISIQSMTEDEDTITVLSHSALFNIDNLSIVEVYNRTTHKYTISKNTGIIRKYLTSPNKKSYGQVILNETNDFLRELVLPVLLKNTNEQFDSLNIYGNSFAFATANMNLCHESLFKSLYLHCSTKSVRSVFFKIMNDRSICINNNHLLVHYGIGKHLKDPNNIVKILRSTFFIEEIARALRCGASDDENYSYDTKYFIDIFFYTGILLYGENMFANNITLINYDNIDTSAVAKYLRDGNKSLFRFSKREASALVKNKNFRKNRPLDIFKGIHDFLALNYRLSNRVSFLDFTPVYNRKSKLLIKQLNALASKSDAVFELPRNSNALNIYGEKLHHCVSSYGRDIFSKELIIIGLYSKNTLFACAEVRNNSLVQLKGKYNHCLSADDTNFILGLLKKLNIGIGLNE